MGIKTLYFMVKALEAAALGWHFATFQLFILGFGFSLQALNFVNMSFMVGNILIEVPSGYLGDRVGQVKTYLFGTAWMIVGGIVYFYSDSFWAFVLAEALSAGGFALHSKALESWLRNRTEEDEYERITKQSRLVSGLGAGVTAVGGSLIGLYHGYDLPWILGAMTFIPQMFIIYWWMLDKDKNFEIEQSPSIGEVMKGLRQREILDLAVLSFLVGFLFQPINMFWPVVVYNKNFHPLLVILLQLCISLGDQISALFNKTPKLFIQVMYLMGIPIIIAGISQNIFVIFGTFMIHQVGRGVYRLVSDIYANRYISNSERSTLNSALALAKMVGNFLGLLVFGWLTTLMAANHTWIVAGVLFIVPLLWIRLRFRSH